MKKMVILDYEDGRPHTLYGTEEEFRRALRQNHPEVRGLKTLDEMVDFLNDEGNIEIHVTELEDDNLLPEGFWYKSQLDYEEPWVREGHFHEEEHADRDPSDDPEVRLGLTKP